MPVSTGFNHVATLTTDMNRTVRFYEEAFEARVLGEVLPREDHPWMKIVDIGGGGQLNIFEVAAEEIVGERQRQGRRGAIDHFAIAVDSKATLEEMRERLQSAGAQEVGEVQHFGPQLLSVFFRDPDGMDLEVCWSPE
jgi:catechol 2,3-dioxygenase-like lactoylglutathione lyase family enzyme